MKELTIEQKAKRYEYIEKCVRKFLEETIEEKQYDDRSARDIDILEWWIDQVDFNSDIIPRGLYLIFDKICKETYYDFMSIGECSLRGCKQEYEVFEKEIGG